MSRNLQSALGKIQRKVMARVRSIVRRGVLSNSNSEGAGQTLQTKLLADDVADEVEHFEQYGFTSHPPGGSEGLVFAVGGERAHAVGINFGNRDDRLSGLEQGEVAMYHPSGSSIIMRNDGSIEAVAAPGQTVNMGGVPPAALAVARLTDTVGPDAAMTAWMAATTAAVETIAGLLEAPPPGTPVVSVAAGTIVSAGAPPAPNFGTITGAGAGSTST